MRTPEYSSTPDIDMFVRACDAFSTGRIPTSCVSEAPDKPAQLISLVSESAFDPEEQRLQIFIARANAIAALGISHILTIADFIGSYEDPGLHRAEIEDVNSRLLLEEWGRYTSTVYETPSDGSDNTLRVAITKVAGTTATANSVEYSTTLTTSGIEEKVSVMIYPTSEGRLTSHLHYSTRFAKNPIIDAAMKYFTERLDEEGINAVSTAFANELSGDDVARKTNESILALFDEQGVTHLENVIDEARKIKAAQDVSGIVNPSGKPDSDTLNRFISVLNRHSRGILN